MGRGGAAAPCGVAEFLACGVPVGASDVSDLRTFAAYGVATYPVGDVERFVAAVRAQSHAEASRPVPGWSCAELADRAFAEFKRLL